MPMTYAMSMLSEVTTKTIRINMTMTRIKTVTNHNVTIRINFDSNHNGPWAAGHDERCGHDTNARFAKSRRSRSWPTCP